MTPRERLSGETRLGLAAAARLTAGRGGNGVNRFTVSRWIQRGCVAAHGGRVTLDGYREGQRWVTSVEALDRFFAALTSSAPPAPLRSPAQARRTLAHAEREAKRMGIL